MKIHILGICGTFMGGLARILSESDHDISGSDVAFIHLCQINLMT